MDKEAPPPPDLLEALQAEALALTAWESLTPVGRRDFIGWINEAKLPETRAKRIGRCCENLLKGKRRPCCYAVVPMDLYKALGEAPDAKARWSKLNSGQKRDFSEWIEDSADKAERKGRVAQAILLITSGETGPS